MAEEKDEKKPIENPVPPQEVGYVKPRKIEDEMQESYLDYAMSVIVSRALPDVRDGLKPVHRRILYAMNELGLRHSVRYKKSALVVGEVLGKYHPHGDMAVYDSMVRMAQEFSMRYRLVDGQGNFGSMDGDSAAAMRYTEARMTSIAEEMLSDIEKDTIDWMPNYDASREEPKVLPARVPNLLLNGQMGIAVGMATNIPPHNLGELVDGTIAVIDNPKIDVDGLLEYVKGPDFPTGASIYNINEIKEAYSTGKGKVVMRGEAAIEEGKRGDYKIIITELPYQVNKSSLVEKIAELVKDKKIVGISDLRDESDRDGVRVVIELKKDAYPQKILNQLYKSTQLQEAFHVNMLALVDGIQPKVLTLKDILELYRDHRVEVVTRRTKWELARAGERAHILEGLKIALDHLDEVISTIKKSANKEVARENLMKRFKLTEIQAQAILDMRLSQLAALERQKIEDEYNEKIKLIKELKAILADPKRILGIIKEELLEVKNKYGDPRKTKIYKRAAGEFSEEDLIPNEDVVVTLSGGTYIKRMPTTTYRTQGRGGKGIIGATTKEEDVIEHLITTKNHNYLLFFTNRGRVFQTKVYEVPAGSRISKGQAIVNLIQCAPDEKVTAMLHMPDYKSDHFLIMVTRKGVVKKTKFKDYANVRKSGLIAIKIDAGDELRWVRESTGHDEVMIATRDGQAIRFPEKDARPMGRATRGVRGIKLRPGDLCIGADVVPQGSKKQILVVSENGLGKKSNVNLYHLQHRGGTGIKTAKVSAKTGKLIGMQIVDETLADVIMMSKAGQIIRLPLKSVSLLGRQTQGVTLMRPAKGDKLAAFSVITEEGETNPPINGTKENGKLKFEEEPGIKKPVVLKKDMGPEKSEKPKALKQELKPVKKRERPAVKVKSKIKPKPRPKAKPKKKPAKKKVVKKAKPKKVVKKPKIKKARKPAKKITKKIRKIAKKKIIKKKAKPKKSIKKKKR